MPTVPVSQTVEAVISYALYQKTLLNVLNFESESALGIDFLEDLHDVLSTLWITGMMPEFSQDLFLTNITVRSLDPTQPLEYVGPVIAEAGGNTSPGLPVNVAIKTRFSTGLIGRSFKGRAYQSGMSENTVIGNTFDSVFAAAVQGVWESLPTVLATGPFTHVVVSRYENGVPRTTGVTTLVLSYTTEILVADMGRRLNNS